MSRPYCTQARPVKAVCYILSIRGDKVRVRATHRGILALLRGMLPQSVRARQISEVRA